MNIPDGVVEGTIGFIVGFIFKVVFGLIEKNKQISDEADHRLRDDVKESDSRHRNHEVEIYKLLGDTRERLAYMEGVRDSNTPEARRRQSLDPRN